jgi:hypothetical protein
MDNSPTSDGLTVVFTNLRYDSSEFEVVSIDPGETFTLFSEPNVEGDEGIVRRVGGATLEPDHGARGWTRVSVVELRALEDIARPSLTIRPSEGEAVSRRGYGLVPAHCVKVLEGQPVSAHRSTRDFGPRAKLSR